MRASLVLASASPRRRELLLGAGLVFRVDAPVIDETPRLREGPRALVRRLARAKAGAVRGEAVVVAADTVVALGASVLNKPRDDREAMSMLRRLAGRVHHVFTGYAVAPPGRRMTVGVAETAVKFRTLSAADLRRYVESGEGRDKAGGYAIQGQGGGLVEWIEGSYTNVVGLPLAEVLAALARAGVRPAR